MPRPHAEDVRREALVCAAAEMIGERGSLDVTVKAIAQRAGMSSALAFHYFGDKDEIITATMRHLLKELGSDLVARLAKAETPEERVDAIIMACLAPQQFDRKTVAAWLVLYLKALSSPGPARLLKVYHGRLSANLRFALKERLPPAAACATADGLGALIDGLYIRHALNPSDRLSHEAVALCRDYVNAKMEQSQPTSQPNHGENT